MVQIEVLLQPSIIVSDKGSNHCVPPLCASTTADSQTAWAMSDIQQFIQTHASGQARAGGRAVLPPPDPATRPTKPDKGKKKKGALFHPFSKKPKEAPKVGHLSHVRCGQGTPLRHVVAVSVTNAAAPVAQCPTHMSHGAYDAE